MKVKWLNDSNKETLDDNHTEDWSSAHSSKGDYTAEVYTLTHLLVTFIIIFCVGI